MRADFLPDPDPEFGHDPHCVRFAGGNPDRLYQQNHCGIYRLDRPGDTWQDIGATMPKSVGYVGFPMVVHPRDPDTLWVFPMDGTSVWPRTAPGGRPAVYRSRDGGKTWKRQDQGLPKSQAWWTVKRQAMTADARDPAGVYFGTTSGEVWGSRDEGRSFRCLARHLPHIYAVEVGLTRHGQQPGDARSSHEVAAVVRVRIPSPLRSYTGRREVGVAVPVLAPELPPTLGGVLAALDGAYPGHPLSDHRRAGPRAPAHQAVRRHATRRATFARRYRPAPTLMIVAALSGG